MSRYTESNADERQADLAERIDRAEHRIEEREQNADEGRDALMRDLIEDYAAYWIGRVRS